MKTHDPGKIGWGRLTLVFIALVLSIIFYQVAADWDMKAMWVEFIR